MNDDNNETNRSLMKLNFKAVNQLVHDADFRTRINALLPLAEEGNIFAQLAISLIYIDLSDVLEGLDQIDANEKAFFWMKKCIDIGMWTSEEASNFNSMLYYTEKEINYLVAKEKELPFLERKELHILADKGDAKSHFTLFEYYLSRNEDDYRKKGLELLQRIAGQGYSEAQYRLAKLYFYGSRDVEKNYVKAAEWYLKVADENNLKYIEYNWSLLYNASVAQCKLGDIYYHGLGVDKDDKQAFMWYKRSAENDYDAGLQNVGVMYYHGRGVEQNYELALEYFKRAVDQGLDFDNNQVAMMYRIGLGVTQDHTQAFQWYKKSADKNHAYAQYEVGLMYYLGEGVEKDYQKACEWIKKAVKQDFDEALNFAGAMYYHGELVKKNYKKAFNLYKKLADKGYAAIQHKLGLMYLHGEGIKKDKKQAYEWVKKAADQGFEDAINCLATKPSLFIRDNT